MKKEKIDYSVTLIPIGIVITLCILFFMFPQESNEVLSKIRFFLGDTLGSYYLIIGAFFFIISLYIAFSGYGDIVLGMPGEKPKYSFMTWGSMMFTCGLAADILFYSFSEWILYASDKHIEELGSIQDWAGVFPLFHWSFIPWSFYLVLAVAFGFMLHVNGRKRQKFSEACRSIIGRYTDEFPGRIIDILAVFALIAGTATTFSVATPLMSSIIEELFHVECNRKILTIVILIITCMVYTCSLVCGINGIKGLARGCIFLFFFLLGYVLLFSGETKYIIETGIENMGRVMQNFIELSTYTDPIRKSSFPQNWTIYYWSYWMVWCVAAPFFIGNISRGRKVREVILGGFGFGVGATVLSFTILGNYSMGLQVKGEKDFLSLYQACGNLYDVVVEAIKTLPFASVALSVLLITMVAFYATSFDSIALIASCYSYQQLGTEDSPHKIVQIIWCILLILLPIALVFSESSMSNLQSVSIISAFPIGIVMICIALAFFKDAKKYIKK